MTGVPLERPDALGEVADVGVTAVGAKLGEGGVEVIQVVLIEAAGPATGEDVVGELLGILGPDKLLIVRGADVDESGDGRGAVGRVEGCVVDGVAVDLADVEIVLDIGDAVRDDAIGDAPDLFRGRAVVIGQCAPVRLVDEGDDAARSLWSAPVVLTRGRRTSATGRAAGLGRSTPGLGGVNGGPGRESKVANLPEPTNVARYPARDSFI